MSTIQERLAGLTIADLEVAATKVGGVLVDTMLLPAGARAGQYETQIMSDTSEWDGWRHWYNTRTEAEAGHAVIVAAVIDGRDLDAAVAR